MKGQPRNQLNMTPMATRPSQEQMTAELLASGQPIQPMQPQQPSPLDNIIGGLGQGAKGLLQGFGDFVNTQKATPEGRLLLNNMLAGVTVALGADPAIGANIVQQGQEQFKLGLAKQEKESEREFELERLGLQQKAETEKAERKAVSDAEKEERQSRRDFAKAGFTPKLTDDPNLPPELLIEFTSPVSGEPVQLVKQTEATKRQVDVFQDGQKTKMYANTVEDAKKIKDINEATEQIERLTSSLIANRRKYTGGVLGPKLKSKMNQDITALRLAYKKMAELGVISESDVKNFIEKALPDPTRITLRQNIIESELTNFRQRALEDRDAAYEGRVYNYQRPIKPITGDEQKNVNDFKYDAQGNIIVPENLKSLSTSSIPQLNIVDGYTVRVKQ